MGYYEQKTTPFIVTPRTWNDDTRFADLALVNGNCVECFAPIGWEEVPMGDTDGQVWHDYWVRDEDMEIALCPQCYEELTKEME